MKQLILASQSPRRAEILKNAGYQFVSLPVDVSEIPDKNLSLDEQIIDIARRKSKACLRLWNDQLISGLNLEKDEPVILAADTLVCFQNQPLGKPENTEMAFDYLSWLSGHEHQVKTALSLIDLASGEELTHLETTHVKFKVLTAEEINAYIQTKEPMDKAGAYGIQGLGGQFVEKYRGDFNNVVGLPLQALENLFKLKKWNLLRLHPAH